MNGEERACCRQKGQHMPKLGGEREQDALRECSKVHYGQRSEEGGAGRCRAVEGLACPIRLFDPNKFQCSGKPAIEVFSVRHEGLRFEEISLAAEYVGAVPTCTLQQRQVDQVGGCCSHAEESWPGEGGRSGKREVWADERHFGGR